MATKPTASIARLLAANNNPYNASSNPNGLAQGGHRQNFVPDLQATVDVGQWTEALAGEADADAMAAEASRAAAADKATIATNAASLASTKADQAAASAAAAQEAAGSVDAPAVSARIGAVENRVTAVEDYRSPFAFSYAFR